MDSGLSVTNFSTQMPFKPTLFNPCTFREPQGLNSKLVFDQSWYEPGKSFLSLLTNFFRFFL